MLVAGSSYIKVEKRTGRQAKPRVFVEVSESGYLLFVGDEPGAIMSESCDVWDFYLVNDPALPAPVLIPDGWVERAGGFFDPATDNKKAPFTDGN